MATMTRLARAWARPPRYSSLDRELLGMPGPVWLLALWCLGSTIVLGLELIFGLNAAANTAMLSVVFALAVGTLLILVTLRRRVPAWFLHLQTLMAIAAVDWVAYRAGSPTGASIAGMTLVAIAGYMGWWLHRLVASTYLILGLAGLAVAFAASGRMPELMPSWLVTTVMSLSFLLAFGALVEHARRQTITDPLTGLLNRSGMQAYVDENASAGPGLRDRSIAVLDLDGFKAVNDRHGHQAGDQILADFAASLRAATRPRDTVVRSGGDEFVLILDDVDEASARDVVERLRATSPSAFSFGVTAWPSGERFDVAVARADEAMYRDKARGRVDPAGE
jgi:diguanylate cyclase (GGDEF)-like protein